MNIISAYDTEATSSFLMCIREGCGYFAGSRSEGTSIVVLAGMDMTCEGAAGKGNHYIGTCISKLGRYV